MNPEDNRLSFSVASRLLTVMGTSLYPTPLDEARQASYWKAPAYLKLGTTLSQKRPNCHPKP